MDITAMPFLLNEIPFELMKLFGLNASFYQTFAFISSSYDLSFYQTFAFISSSYDLSFYQTFAFISSSYDPQEIQGLISFMEVWIKLHYLNVRHWATSLLVHPSKSY